MNNFYKFLQTLNEEDSPKSFSDFLKLQESRKNFTEAKEEKVVEPEDEVPVEPSTGSSNVAIAPDGNIQISTDKNVSINKTDGTTVSVAEAYKFLNRRDTDFLFESFMVDDCGMLESEFKSLTEDMRTDSLKELVRSILDSLQDKLNAIDTSVADRSRGDIKQLAELPAIQDAITQLETAVERDETAHPDYSRAINTIVKSILYLNQYAATFKDAYRNKKTLLIMKYQSLVLSIISSISFLLSTILNYKGGEITVQQISNDILQFAPLESLETFNKSVDTGEFKTVIRDTNMLREFYLEVPVETMSVVLEANEFIPMVVNGIKNIYSSLGNNQNLMNLLYKAAGYIVLLFSLRDSLYTFFRMKTKVSDMVGSIQNFANLNIGGNVLNKLQSFASKFKTDAESSSEICKREIEDENRKFLTKVKTIQAQSTMADRTPAEAAPSEPESVPVSQPTETVPADINALFDF